MKPPFVLLLVGLPVLVLPSLLSLLGVLPGHLHLARMAVRAARAFRDFNAANVDLWERYLQAQRPWEWLHWVRSSDGWQLEGSKLPPVTDLPPKTRR